MLTGTALAVFSRVVLWKSLFPGISVRQRSSVNGYRERTCAGTLSEQCWFPGLAISNAKIEIYFSNEI